MLFSRSENSEFKPRRRGGQPITAHPFFVPSLAIWGAALAGLSVLVLPADTINQITTIAALGVLDNFARTFFALLAALVGAACGYFAATKWRNRLPGRPDAIMDRAAEHVRPIDPVTELGSESLDAPIEEEQPADDALELDTVAEAPEEESPEVDAAREPHDTLELGAELEAEVHSESESEAEDPLKDEHCKPVEAAPEPSDKPLLRRRRNRGKPVELVQALGDHRARQAALHKDLLDLGAFSQLAEHKQAQSASKPKKVSDPAPTAVEKLRAVPPQDLSLVQMVERLAVALHERQQAAYTRPQPEQAAERDAALAEALKALSLFTENGIAAPNRSAENDQANAGGANDGTEAELRDALSKLQSMRGAA